MHPKDTSLVTDGKVYLLALYGIKDREFKLVSEATWTWIFNKDTPPPACQLTGRDSPEDIEDLSDWEGSSPDNDRAIQAEPDTGEIWDRERDALDFARQNGLTIVEEWEGSLY